MRTFKSILLFSAALSLFAACKEDVKEEYTPSKTVELKIVVTDNGSPMMLTDHADLSTGFDFELNLFKLYLSNITLTNTDGTDELVKGVDIVSIGEDGENVVQLSIPYGNYKSLKLGYGLDADQNNSDPSSFDSDHPLSNWQSMHWPMIKYRFVKLEGYATSLTDSSEFLVSIHPGTDPLYQIKSYTFDNGLTVNDNSNSSLELSVDINDLFDGPGGIIDFINGGDQVHMTGADDEFGERFMVNMASGFELNVISE